MLGFTTVRQGSVRTDLVDGCGKLASVISPLKIVFERKLPNCLFDEDFAKASYS
jgi:hypothetical protein